jgi:hypothetical protein
MTRAVGKSQWHRRMRGDDGNDKALPQTSDSGSDKRCGGDGGDSGVAMMAEAVVAGKDSNFG